VASYQESYQVCSKRSAQKLPEGWCIFTFDILLLFSHDYLVFLEPTTITKEFAKLPCGGQATAKELSEQMIALGLNMTELPSSVHLFIHPHPLVSVMRRPGESQYIAIKINQGPPL